MGKIRNVGKVKPFAGMIFSDSATKRKAENLLKNLLGKIDVQSKIIPFGFTSYYEPEMGKGLFRCWIAFEKLISPEKLADMKIAANEIEEKFGEAGKRIINIDPGYIDLSKIVLASTKDFSHRLCVGKNIFAELTLIYKHHAFEPLPWTYPDYQSRTATDFFINARLKLTAQKENANDTDD